MGGGNWGEGRGREKAGGGQYLSDAKGDVAHVEAPGLSGHLAPDHGHRRRGHSQAVRGHGGEKGGGWNLTRSFENSTAGLDCSRAILHTPPPQFRVHPLHTQRATGGQLPKDQPEGGSTPLCHGSLTASPLWWSKGQKPGSPGHKPYPATPSPPTRSKSAPSTTQHPQFVN